MKLRVAVVDDHSVAVRGVAEVVRDAGGVEFAGVFAALDDPDLLAVCQRPIVVIADLLAALSSGCGSDNQLLLTMTVARCGDTLDAALSRGIRGFIGKSAQVSTLIRAIETVASGDLYIDGEFGAAFTASASQIGAGHQTASSALSRREREVLLLVAEGLTHKQIGTRLSLSKATVDTYVHRVRQKTGSVNKAAMTRFAMELRLTNTRAA